jgi:hypothetical protein
MYIFDCVQMNLLSVTVATDGGLLYRRSVNMNDQMFR